MFRICPGLQRSPATFTSSQGFPWVTIIDTQLSVILGGGHIIFAFSAVRRPPSGRLVSAHLKEKYFLLR